jgi:hypothetical protein
MDNLSRGYEKPDCFVIVISFVEKPDGKPRILPGMTQHAGRKRTKFTAKSELSLGTNLGNSGLR